MPPTPPTTLVLYLYVVPDCPGGVVTDSLAQLLIHIDLGKISQHILHQEEGEDNSNNLEEEHDGGEDTKHKEEMCPFLQQRYDTCDSK